MSDGVRLTTRIAWRAGEVRSRVRSSSEEASLTAARAILTEANKTVPYETGRLRDSGKVTPARAPGSAGGSAMVSYATPYAARLHEHPEYNFRGRGRGKWLQLTIQEMAGRIAGIMASVMARRIAGR